MYTAGKRGHEEGDAETGTAKRPRVDANGDAQPSALPYPAQPQQHQEQQDHEMADASEEQHQDTHDSSLQLQRKDEHTAFVRPLANGTSEEALKAYFQPCGPILSVRIPKHHATGQKRVSTILYARQACSAVAHWDGSLRGYL